MWRHSRHDEHQRGVDGVYQEAWSQLAQSTADVAHLASLLVNDGQQEHGAGTQDGEDGDEDCRGKEMSKLYQRQLSARALRHSGTA